MRGLTKQVLVHADGTVEEYKGEAIAGVRFHVPFMKDGDQWERVFVVHWTGKDSGFDEPFAIVGVEESCRMVRTAEQIRTDDEKFRARVLNACLRGIRGEADAEREWDKAHAKGAR